MDMLIDFVMQAVPEALAEYWMGKLVPRVRYYIKPKWLQYLVMVLVAVFFVALGILAAFMLASAVVLIWDELR